MQILRDPEFCMRAFKDDFIFSPTLIHTKTLSLGAI
jgi:hypothetical protein